MNTAVRTLSRGTLLSVRWVNAVSFKLQWVVVALLFSVLFSALFLVYIKDVNRRLTSDLQTLTNIQNNLDIQWSKLLLEESAFSSSARIVRVAALKLDMEIPASKSLLPIDD